jgi:hypothetical protein
MILVNHELKALYIHIPKCGGLYVSKILTRYYNFFPLVDCYVHLDVNPLTSLKLFDDSDFFLYVIQHGIINSLDKILENYVDKDKYDIKKYKTFTFIRNPYERIISGLKYLKQTAIHNPHNVHITDNEIFESILNNKESENSFIYFHTIPSQFHNLNRNGVLNINFIGNVSELDKDLIEILKQIGIKKIIHLENEFAKNKTKNNKPFYVFYEQYLLNKINDAFKDDFHYFAFKKVLDMESLKTYFESFNK